MPTLDEDVQHAVAAAASLRALRESLEGMIEGGADPDRLEAAMMNAYREFTASGDERMADLALDGMDLLTGWCSPNSRLRRRTSA